MDTESSRTLAAGEQLLAGLRAWQLLGGGAHCESWLAWSEDLWSPVVVKLPRPDDVLDAGVAEDLVLELRAHALVCHPGFQRVWAADVEGPVPHLVLEYVEGPSLATLHEQRALTVPDVVLVGLQLASSLRYLHGRRLVHLDVKPDNVVVRNGRAVLVDLGSLTPDGRVYGEDGAPGTTPYMSPELLDEGRVSPAADVYALGCTLRELLAAAPSVPAVDDLVDQMAGADAASRPTLDHVLAVLHDELVSVGSRLWPEWVAPTVRLQRT